MRSRLGISPIVVLVLGIGVKWEYSVYLGRSRARAGRSGDRTQIPQNGSTMNDISLNSDALTGEQ